MIATEFLAELRSIKTCLHGGFRRMKTGPAIEVRVPGCAYERLLSNRPRAHFSIP